MSKGIGLDFVDEAVANGVADKTGEIVDAEFGHHSGAVAVDGFRAERKVVGDLFGALAFDQQEEGFAFTVAESGEGIGAPFALFADIGSEIALAGEDLVESEQKFGDGSSFEHNGASAGGQKFRDGWPRTRSSESCDRDTAALQSRTTSHPARASTTTACGA